MNSYFLYKQRHLRDALSTKRSLKEFIGFDGLVTTDSGAFQGLSRQLYLSNRDIVRFQDKIGSDVIAPLDLITPPGDKRTTAEKKLYATEKRVAEALDIAATSIVAGVQQGGRFRDLRQASVERLLKLEVEYLAIGSLVPFFARNHDITFPGKIIRDMRHMAGPEIPIHVYGAGDPVQLAFFAALGATVFDSSSYAHFANGGWYMTPFGALDGSGPIKAGEFRCECAICASNSIEEVFADAYLLSQHNLWTICTKVRTLQEVGMSEERFSAYLDSVLEVHKAWFPDSRLPQSWSHLLEEFA